MPIPENEINRDIVVVDAEIRVRALRDQIPLDERRKRYVVVPRDGNTYATFRLVDLIEHFKTLNPVAEGWMLEMRLQDLGEFIERRTRPGVDQATADLDTIRRTWNPLRDAPPAVLSAGVVIGVLRSALRGGGGDVEFLDQVTHRANGGGRKDREPEEAAPEPEAEAPTTLTGEEAAPTPPKRFITAEFEGHDKSKPLQVGESYTLAFGVDVEIGPNVLASTGLDETRVFAPGEQEAELTVQLVSNDFDIYTNAQKLRIPRTGKSKNKARFDIEPKHNGEGTLTAVFMKEGNIIQGLVLKLNVGLPGKPTILGSETRGRPPEQAFAVQRRDLTLLIQYTGTEFNLTILGVAGASATLPITLAELEAAVLEARKVLNDIVELRVGNRAVYQMGIDIPADVNKKALVALAEAGWTLFRQVFLHRGSDLQAKQAAKRLREMARNDSLKIQIASKQLFMPWGILYTADQFDPNNVDPELFLGFKHIIEHIPFQQNMDVLDCTISSQPRLAVGLNLNDEIDAQMGYPLIAPQKKYWDGLKQRGGVDVAVRTSQNDVVKALADGKTPDQIAYFYCHAVSKSLAEGGAAKSILQFGKNQSVTLGQLDQLAPTDTRLPGTPLVFINACESAELSPLFYDGFMPYFVDKGARGVIGTECPVPALFAADWAKKFFDQFLGGKSLGETFLELRRDYYYNHNNLLGLLYAVYCDADTQVAPALALE